MSAMSRRAPEKPSEMALLRIQAIQAEYAIGARLREAGDRLRAESAGTNGKRKAR
jgi:hypothetical protein